MQLIYNFPEQLFADAGVMAIEHADFDGIERLALVTGALPTAVLWKLGRVLPGGVAPALTVVRAWPWRRAHLRHTIGLLAGA